MTKYHKAVVFGGSGMIGSKVVAGLKAAGLDVLSASRRTGVNTVTGEGLAQALAGADIVVDASDVPSYDLDTLGAFFRTSGANIFAAARAAGVRHHVTLSIVGVDVVRGNPYFDAKLTQEEAVRASGVPYTIARATQFYEFLPTIASGLARDGVARLPGACFRPLAAGDVAAALVTIALGAARNDAVTIAGPEIATFDAWLQRFFNLTGDTRTAVTDPDATYFGGRLQANSIAPASPDFVGPTTLENWMTSPAAAIALADDRHADAAKMIDQHLSH